MELSTVTGSSDTTGGRRTAPASCLDLPLIEDWCWPYWAETPASMPVHVFAGAENWRRAAWMLASWFHTTDRGWNVVIHDDGTLSPDAAAAFQDLFFTTRIVSRTQADSVLATRLLAFPFCAEFRERAPQAMRLFDAAQFAQTDSFILFEPSLLFFSRPDEILEWVETPGATCRFAEDPTDRSVITSGEARDELCVKLWPRVNTGISLLTTAAIDLDLCDRALARTSLMRGDPARVEATLFALCAARHGRGGLLPARYEVLPRNEPLTSPVARLYHGDAAARFDGDSLKRVRPALLSMMP